MIRISIFFLAIFSLIGMPSSWSQEDVTFNCYNLDSISWDLSIANCPNPTVDSFRILTRTDQGADFKVLVTGTDPIPRGYRDDIFKTDQAVMVQYFVRCPDLRMVQSDTMSLASLREAVELDSVRVLANGDVELTWKEKPISGVRYVVNAAVQGSSQVLATNIQGNNYTDIRGLATRDIEYYSVSATLECGYTFPEPDSFYHTSLLAYNITPCGGEINFDLTPFSYWAGGTTASDLIVLRNGQVVDTMSLSVGETTFTYNGLVNNETYTFWVRETGNDSNAQVAYSNPITINTDFYEPIKWIVVDEVTFDVQNQATISWTTNDHPPDFLFQLHRNESSIDIPKDDLIYHPGAYKYSYVLPDFSFDDTEYRISLQDSCGNTVESRPKQALLTQGQLNGGIDLNIEWSDIGDEEWTISAFDIFYQTNGTFALLGSVSGSTFDFQYSFDENNPLDSICYYLIARGEEYFLSLDSTADLNIRSNTVCLHGETVVQLPNAYKVGQTPYMPIIVPRSNISSYAFRIFDRYGNLVFESHNPSEGWNGTYQGKDGFMDVYAVQVEITNRQGEQIEKSGSLFVFP